MDVRSWKNFRCAWESAPKVDWCFVNFNCRISWILRRWETQINHLSFFYKKVLDVGEGGGCNIGTSPHCFLKKCVTKFLKFGRQFFDNKHIDSHWKSTFSLYSFSKRINNMRSFHLVTERIDNIIYNQLLSAKRKPIL